MRKLLSQVNAFFDAFEKCVIIVFMTAMVVILAVQVFTRYCLGFSFSWAEQLVRIGFVWMTFTGASMACKASMHLTIDLLKYVMGPRAVRIMGIWASGFTVFFAVYIGWHIFGLVLQQMNRGQTFASMTWLPVWSMYLAGVVGMLGVAVRTLEFGLLPLLALKKEGDSV